MSSSTLLLNPSDKDHIALLYQGSKELNVAIATYLNEGLRRGQFCVYATVHYRNEGHLENFSKLIHDYNKNVESGNLLVVDLAPFYIAAMVGDMKPFEDAKKLFVDNAKDRQDKHIRFVGDGTGFLFENKHFDACAMIEEWWQDKPFEGSYVCPYSKQLFSSYPHDIHAERAVLTTHDIAIETSEVPSQNNQRENQQSSGQYNTDQDHQSVEGGRN